MGQRFLILVIVLLLVPGAQAITTYDISVEGQDVVVNVTFELYTSSPDTEVNYWTTTFPLPEGAVFVRGSDSRGALDPTVKDNQVFIQTNDGPAKDREVVSLLYRVPGAVDDRYSPLQFVELGLSAFEDVRKDVPDERTFVTFQAQQEVLSFTTTLGFIAQMDGRELRLQGVGPVGMRVFFGQGGVSYEHYLLFGEADLTFADEIHDVVPAVTGLTTEVPQLPIVVLPDKEYSRTINAWSAGEHQSGIAVLRTVDNEDSFLATMIHETSHGTVAQALRWDRTSIVWFDEGVAEYIEFLVNKKRGVRQAEIFGSPVRWQEGLRFFTLPPRSTADDLWEYYRSEDTFMETWTPVDPATRDFGYAFSELVIRDFIQRKGPAALQDVFQQLLALDEQIEDPINHLALFRELLATDFRPCYRSNRAQFESCLGKINSMDPDIPEGVVIKRTEEVIIIPKIPQSEEPVLGPLEQFIAGLQALIDTIRGWFGL